MNIVFSYGGSIIAPVEIDKEFVLEVASLIKRLSERHELVVVVGGGRPARDAIEKAREGGASEAYCDFVGILSTRENANALRDALGEDAVDVIPESIVDAVNCFGDRVVVMGGTEPGHSTDAVAALVADWIQADLLVNASNIDFVYDKNPKIHSDAKPLTKMSPKELVDLVSDMESNAGEYALIDLLAAKVIARSGIKTIVLDGRDLKNIEMAVDGEKFTGTVIE